ncbi:alpha-hydroxy acid oxidase [Streptomyces sp. NPDC033754]|uniref:alpha-hydroxy acid oxidase n=1 Tax=unclassified Streptomyces TaxID=2593676 RepID=UPI0033DD7F47
MSTPYDDPAPAPLSAADYSNLARAELPPDIWDWLDGGAERERTMAANRAALDRIALTPRVLADVSACDTSTHLLGRSFRSPVAVAPMAYQRLFHPAGETAVARAAAAAGIPHIVSTLTSTPLEDLTSAGADTWFQLYWLRDRSSVLRLVRRAEEAGCGALVVTVDVPVMGRRLRDLKHAFALPPHVRAVLLDAHSDRAHHGTAGVSAVAEHTAETFSSSVTWDDLAWLMGQTRLPVLVKGVLHPDDALRAAETGAAGVVVSNHGGRQLDGAVSTAVALPAIAAHLTARGATDCLVLADSGVRHGSDVLTLLALGASAVLIGRPVLWGLAAAGEQGCADVLGLLDTEFRHAMALAGCPDLDAVSRLRVSTAPCPPSPGAHP